MEAESKAGQLRDSLRSTGAGRGAVACRLAGSGLAVCTWGPVPGPQLAGQQVPGAPVSGGSVFEAGSVTKAVTGLLLALAIEAGEVSSSDRLSRFLPGTGLAREATLAELATHSSGLPRVPAATLIRALAHLGNPYRGATLARLIRDARRVRPRKPGAATYSNVGVALLGQALARTASVPYQDLARIRVLTPLSMTCSGDLPRSALMASAKPSDMGAFAPAGGLRATVGDLLRLAWVATRPSESPFPAAAISALTPRVPLHNGYVGWCWMLGPPDGPRYAWHNGATGASWAFIGANSEFAIAACVPPRRRSQWDVAARSTVADVRDDY